MNTTTIEKPEEKAVASAKIERRQSVSGQREVGPRVKLDTPAVQEPVGRKVGIPPGMPFRTKEEAAKRKRKKKQVSPTPTNPVEADRSVIKHVSEPTLKPSITADTLPGTGDAIQEKKPILPAELTPKHRLDFLTEAAKANELGAIEALRAFLENNPAVYHQYGDTARAARFAFATLSSGDNPLAREAIFKRSEEALKNYLPGESHCQTERLLAEQIVLCSLRLSFLDYETANHATSTNSKLVSLLLKRQEQAQNQMFRAISKLEKFRTLKVKPE